MLATGACWGVDACSRLRQDMRLGLAGSCLQDVGRNVFLIASGVWLSASTSVRDGEE